MQLGLAAVGLVASLPGLAYAAYYVLRFQDCKLLLEVRSWEGSELLAAGMGVGLGVTAGVVRTHRPLRIGLRAAVLVLAVCLPYLKEVVLPLQMENLRDSWSGEVCCQTTASTCGPACAATMLRHFGIQATEQELARRCHTTQTGTENWYITRELRSRGLSVKYVIGPPAGSLPVPCIAGVKLGSVGHYITILGAGEDSYTVGDPAGRLREIPKAEIFSRYEFTGFFMEVSKG